MDMIGKVIQYNNSRGFGFIKDKSGQKIFVNYTAIENSTHHSLRTGQMVRFEIAQGMRGAQAVKVNPVQH